MVTNHSRIFLLGISILALSGCSSVGKSTATGAGIGATVGGIAGSLLPGDASSKPQNVIVGAVAGGTLGALSGALIHKSMEDKERESFEKGKSQAAADFAKMSAGTVSSGSSSRHYVPPKIERHLVADEIRGNTLVESHYEQVIVEEGHWE